MITFILPGYSPSNRQWAEEVANKLQVTGEIRPIIWDHWDDSNAVFKPEEKVQMLIGIMAGGSANIIAKSIGTLVASLLISQIPKQITKVIYCGIPSGNFKNYQEVYTKAMTFLPADKILVLQNQADPLGSFEVTQAAIQQTNPKITVKSMPASDHNYPYFDEFQKFIG
ncbi:hypothetical protein A2630_02940 [Candidatus Woesebacteria bacterium RIFCSPHIGHO2_01_FULL_44_10]|uniref:Alpha/beta hydrolase n=1 Tax=Candidatus Woesebacteria bacterium RIFCSPLOWO2_01_FULL_44_14 TaxID=1802525 RepID=A0A1F8C4D2_9BACT|nr:MAG: hypothetical protein A2630_02940 [Candidatus Woesebacteria bacterium RIFCSPHIGHO2_01_FULL_44_10]OGM55740.1 MAG: hypothetical protein A3F62_04635 [Candidatus Woesebacteria bacterium RIFCSPHIGHO2_12_FULL_44_11]OGM70525.1 MAG: hypothetical protein A2975_01970 [Candidatus Woesebacteria bacterium RIFCSPLOWO2_01_FULL_44_14]